MANINVQISEIKHMIKNTNKEKNTTQTHITGLSQDLRTVSLLCVIYCILVSVTHSLTLSALIRMLRKHFIPSHFPGGTKL